MILSRCTVPDSLMRRYKVERLIPRTSETFSPVVPERISFLAHSNVPGDISFLLLPGPFFLGLSGTASLSERIINLNARPNAGTSAGFSSRPSSDTLDPAPNADRISNALVSMAFFSKDLNDLFFGLEYLSTCNPSPAYCVLVRISHSKRS